MKYIGLMISQNLIYFCVYILYIFIYLMVLQLFDRVELLTCPT